MDQRLRAAAVAAKGFMPPDEGDALHDAALGPPERPCRAPRSSRSGSYCGRSTVWLGAAARERRHRAVRGRPPPRLRGEPGRLGVARPVAGRRRPRRAWTPCPTFRRTIHDAGLEDVVVAVVGPSPLVAAHWRTPLRPAASSTAATASSRPGPTTRAGRRTWRSGGLLAIHDVFPDPADGGRPPYEEIYLPGPGQRPVHRGVGRRLAAGPARGSDAHGGAFRDGLTHRQRRSDRVGCCVVGWRTWSEAVAEEQAAGGRGAG